MPLCQPTYLAVLAYAIAAAAVHTISAAAAAAYLHCSPGYWRPCPGPDHLPADGEGPGVAGGVHHARARPPGGPAGWDYLRARGRGASVISSVTSTPQTAGWPHQPTTCQPPSAHQLISRSITMWTRLCCCAKCLRLSVCVNFLLHCPRSLHYCIGEGPGVAEGVRHACQVALLAGITTVRASSAASLPQTAGWPHRPATGHSPAARCRPLSADQLISRSNSMWTRLCCCAKCLQRLSLCVNFLPHFHRNTAPPQYCFRHNTAP